MLFTLRRVKRIIGESCANVISREVATRRAHDREQQRRTWAATKLQQSWKLCRWKKFGWAALRNLHKHREYESQREDREDAAWRLRVAKRAVKENEFLYGINGDRLTGPRAALRKGTPLPSGTLDNPGMSEMKRREAALRDCSDAWIRDQAERQVRYAAEEAAKYTYKKDTWNLLLEERKKKEKEAVKEAALLKFCEPKFKLATAPPKNKLSKRIRKKKKQEANALRKLRDGPGTPYDFDDPDFWGNATPIDTGPRDGWEKKSIYKDIYQARARPLVVAKQDAGVSGAATATGSVAAGIAANTIEEEDDDDDDDDQSQHGDMGESSSSSSSAASSTEYDPVQDMMEANGWSKDKLTSGAVKETLPDVGEEEQSQSSNAGNSNAHSKTKTASHTTSHSEHHNKKSVGEGSSESDDDEDHDESEHRQHHHRRHHKVLPHKKHVQKHTQQKKKTIKKAKKQHAVHKTQSHHEDLGESDDENEGELSETEAKASTSSDNWPVVNDSPSTSIAIHHKNEQGEDDLLADPSADEVAP